MADRGLVVNARNAAPERSEVTALGLTAGWVRTIVYDFDSFEALLNRLDDVTGVCALLNSETDGVGGDYSGWRDTVQRFADRFRNRVDMVECGNELDLLGIPAMIGADFPHPRDMLRWQAILPGHHTDPTRQRISPLSAANLVRVASPILREAGMLVALTSVAGPNWVEYLRSTATMVGDAADVANLHPYGQRMDGFPNGWGFGEYRDAIQTAHDVSGLPVVVTECGIKVGDAGGEQGQAEYVRRWIEITKALPSDVLGFAAYFCWADAIGGPSEHGDQAFGLRDDAWRARPAWTTFAQGNDAGQVQPPVPPVDPPAEPPSDSEFVLGFKDWHDADPKLLGDPIGKERGGIQGFSVQRSTRGRLMAQYLADPASEPINAASGEYRRSQGWVLTFWDDATDQRWLWDEAAKVSRRLG